MSLYRVAIRVHDLLVQEVDADDEESATAEAMVGLALLCIEDDEPLTVEIVAVAKVTPL